MKQQGFAFNEEKDPVKRKRNLEVRRGQIWEQVITLLDQADILTHELDTVNQELREVKEEGGT